VHTHTQEHVAAAQIDTATPSNRRRLHPRALTKFMVGGYNVWQLARLVLVPSNNQAADRLMWNAGFLHKASQSSSAVPNAGTLDGVWRGVVARAHDT